MDEILVLVQELIAENLKLRKVVQSNLRETETISREMKELKEEVRNVSNVR